MARQILIPGETGREDADVVEGREDNSLDESRNRGFFEGRASRLADGSDVGQEKEESRITAGFLAE